MKSIFDPTKEIVSNAKIKKNLQVVIESLEFMQEEAYSPERNLTLAYLYDIIYDEVPKHLFSTKFRNEMKKQAIQTKEEKYQAGVKKND